MSLDVLTWIAFIWFYCLFYYYSENRHMIFFPFPNCSTTSNILNQHLEVINILRWLYNITDNYIKAFIIQNFMNVTLLQVYQSTLARHPQDKARTSLPKLCLQNLPHLNLQSGAASAIYMNYTFPGSRFLCGNCEKHMARLNGAEWRDWKRTSLCTNWTTSSRRGESKRSAVSGLQGTHFNSLSRRQLHAVKDFSVCPDSVMW